MKKLYTFFLSLSILIVGLFLAPGCFFDPDPGPDANAGADMEADADTDTDADGDGGCPPLVYSSAADPIDLVVTAVGLPDAVQSAVSQVDAWSSTSTVPVSANVGENADFALRIEAQAGDHLFISMNDTPTTRTIVVPDADDTLDPDAIFHEVHVSATDADTVVISGNSDLLEEGFLVIGGNVTQSAARATPVECLTECSFSLTIPGESGDAIALFIALDGDCAGLTPSYDLVIE